MHGNLGERKKHRSVLLTTREYIHQPTRNTKFTWTRKATQPTAQRSSANSSPRTPEKSSSSRSEPLSQIHPAFVTHCINGNAFLPQIYETKKGPHTYTTYMKYTRTGASRSELLTPLDSTLDIALSAFKDFFKDKTGLDWEERASTSTPPMPKTDGEGNALPPHEGWFHYDEHVGLLSSILKRGREDAFDASKFK